MKIVSLNGCWKVSGCDQKNGAISFNGNVPGCVHTDLENAGIIKDIFYRDNSLKVQWIENCNFNYTKKFKLSKVYPNAYLEFDGLDTYCDVYLNGKMLGQADNMFISHSFCVDGIIKEGENIVDVNFRSPIKEVEKCEPLKGCFTTERLHTRRIQCTYGWDWVDRFVTMGIYKDVRLSFHEKNELESFYLVSKNVNPYTAQLKYNAVIRNFTADNSPMVIEIKDPSGNTVYSRSRNIIDKRLDGFIDISLPQLWYPKGYGEQPLYNVTVTTSTSHKSFMFGIRELVVIQPEDLPGSKEKIKSLSIQAFEHLKEIDKNASTSGFIVLVNNIRIMCKGACWVPSEPFPSAETKEKITSILELSTDAGLNMIRIWGGGIFESDHFYDECDRLGILVAQDFLMACGHYPEKEEWFIDALQKETRDNSIRLRNHACLAWWHGDNENAVDGNDDITDYPGYISVNFGIKPVLLETDPDHLFLASSPYGGNKYSSATAGTTHNTVFIGDFFKYILEHDMHDYRDIFSKYIARFVSEQPSIGMPFVSSLRRFMNEKDIFEDEKISEFHTKHNPDLGKTTLYEIVRDLTIKIFGSFSDGLDRIRKMQMLQCEWIRISIELFRRNKWYSSGILYWMLDDCWPAANGWSFIDYYAMPKPSLYAFKRGAKPVITSIEKANKEYSIYVCNDSLDKVTGKGRLYIHGISNGEDKCSMEFRFSVPQNTSEAVFRINIEEIDLLLDENSVLICDIDCENGQADRSFFISKTFSEMNITYEPPKIVEQNNNCITVTALSFNPYVLLDVPYLLDDNGFMIKKGETKTVKIIRKLK